MPLGAPTMFGSKPEMPMTKVFFHHGVVALAVPYLQPQAPPGRGNVHPHSTEMYL